MARPAVAPRAAVAPVPPPLAEADLVAKAIRALRDGDANASLALLDQHRARFGGGALGPEASAVRISALLGIGRTSAALVELERLPLDRVPGREEWHIVRGELRAAAGHWRQAEEDFSQALAMLSEDEHTDLAERALWGRALARARRGDVAGARADQALYLRRFPGGRFAAKARLGLQPPSPSGAPSAP